MRSHRHFFLFFILFSSVCISIFNSSSMPLGTAATPVVPNYWDKFTLLSSHFRPQINSTLHGGVKVDIQSPVLVPGSLQTLDTGYNPETKVYEIRSKITFTFQIACYTTTTIATAYPDRDTDKSFDLTWLHLRTANDRIQASNGEWTSDITATVNVPNIQLGSMVLPGCDEFVSFDMRFDDPTPTEIDYGNGIIAHPKAFVATLEESLFESAQKGDITSGVHFTADITTALQSLALDKTVPSVGEDGQTILNEQINTLNLGVRGGPIQSTNTERETQIGASTLPQGRLYNDNRFLLHLRPNVARNYQMITNSFAAIDLDNYNDWLSNSKILNTPLAVNTTHTRTVGATVTNKFIFATIRTTFILFSTGELVGKQTTDPVDLTTDPVDFDDQYWYNIVTGTTGVTVTEKSSPFLLWLDELKAWWGKYGVWIIIGIIGVVAVVGLIYINSITGNAMSRSAGDAIKRKIAERYAKK